VRHADKQGPSDLDGMDGREGGEDGEEDQGEEEQGLGVDGRVTVSGNRAWSLMTRRTANHP
jgi:hypothetical protein